MNCCHILIQPGGNSGRLSCNICFVFVQQKNGSVPQYYTNRALCLLKLSQWTAATRDCKAALAIDYTWVKGHFFLGQALMELECYEEAIVQLHMGRLNSLLFKTSIHITGFLSFSAHDLAMTQKMNFGDDITSQLRLAKKKHFAQQESKRIKEESDLQVNTIRNIICELDINTASLSSYTWNV